MLLYKNWHTLDLGLCFPYLTKQAPSMIRAGGRADMPLTYASLSLLHTIAGSLTVAFYVAFAPSRRKYVCRVNRFVALICWGFRRSSNISDLSV